MSAYFALAKRTLTEFREERLHRLLVGLGVDLKHWILNDSRVSDMTGEFFWWNPECNNIIFILNWCFRCPTSFWPLPTVSTASHTSRHSPLFVRCTCTRCVKILWIPESVLIEYYDRYQYGHLHLSPNYYFKFDWIGVLTHIPTHLHVCSSFCFSLNF